MTRMSDKENKAETKRDQKYYESIGFMCGLEIHQRLATGTKLFCSCPSDMQDSGAVSARIERKQKAVAGELGAVDVSAEFEEMRNRKFVYNIFDSDTCLVEIDEEPPHEMNKEALAVALSMSSALSMKVVDEPQPMRKEVVDGSDPSAFQRSTLIALDGAIKAGGDSIDIPSLFLEEESCGIDERHESNTIYDADRLGIPLIEVDTAPTIKTPLMAKAVALKLGTLLRLTGKVQRGIGTRRQDVNGSIKGGVRVEIKGMQELDTMHMFIENEVVRQQALLEIRDELKRRNASVSKPVLVDGIFKGTAARIIREQMEKGGDVHAIALHGFAGLVGREVNPKRRLGTEISDYVKFAGVKGIIHSDEDLKKYEISEEEISALKKRLGIGKEDAFAIIACGKENTTQALMMLELRANMALNGVPLETRGVADTELCTTKVLRPLPSGSRMYPETDIIPIPITKEMMKKAKESAPDIDRERKALVHSIGEKLAEQMLTSPSLGAFKALTQNAKAQPEFVANILLQKFVELRRNGFDAYSIGAEKVEEIFSLYWKKEITKQGVEELLKLASKDKREISKIVKERALERLSGAALEKVIHEIKSEKKPENADMLRRFVMEKHRLVIDGEELNAVIRKLYSK